MPRSRSKVVASVIVTTVNCETLRLLHTLHSVVYTGRTIVKKLIGCDVSRTAELVTHVGYQSGERVCCAASLGPTTANEGNSAARVIRAPTEVSIDVFIIGARKTHAVRSFSSSPSPPPRTSRHSRGKRLRNDHILVHARTHANCRTRVSPGQQGETCPVAQSSATSKWTKTRIVRTQCVRSMRV